MASVMQEMGMEVKGLLKMADGTEWGCEHPQGIILKSPESTAWEDQGK